VALQLAEREPRIERVLAVGMAVDLFDFGVVTVLKQPKAFIHADHDEYGKLEHAQKLIAEASEPKKLFVVPDATHLCPGRLDAFSEQARAAVDWLLSA
jgi:alpha/beta superfamily hydrolase